ncbi:MAG TPA: hypothetical protein VGI71_23960 [Scandinavium sp.]|jgi:hypothetical protein
MSRDITSTGGETVPFADPLNLAAMSLRDVTEYRQELVTAILNPGAEYDLVSDEAGEEREEYKKRLELVDAYLAKTTGSPPGGNLP